MTNFEWIMQNDAKTVKMVKDILADKIAVVDGKITKCSMTDCSECEFEGELCIYETRIWLESEYEEEKAAPKKKAMISQPMNGLTNEEIEESRNRAIAHLESLGYEVVNTLFTDEWYSSENMEKRVVRNIPLCFMAKSIENMCLCDVAYFCKGWENARGCKIEHECAKAYGLEIIFEGEKN